MGRKGERMAETLTDAELEEIRATSAAPGEGNTLKLLAEVGRLKAECETLRAERDRLKYALLVEQDVLADAYRTGRREAQQEAWQPMDTAPRDGSRVLVWDGMPVFANDIRELIGKESAQWRDDEGSAIEPTFWMPLPEAPR